MSDNKYYDEDPLTLLDSGKEIDTFETWDMNPGVVGAAFVNQEKTELELKEPEPYESEPTNAQLMDIDLNLVSFWQDYLKFIRFLKLGKENALKLLSIKQPPKQIKKVVKQYQLI